MVEGDINNLVVGTYQRETISNLFYSGIPTEIISLQLDISKEDTDEKERVLDKHRSAESSMNLFYLNVSIDLAIKHA